METASPEKSESPLNNYSYEPTGKSSRLRHLLRFVGHNKNVLEIGAGPGSILKIIKQQNHCSVSAIEIDDECATKLRLFCNQVWQLDLNNTDWTKPLADQKYDTVLLADVLEHLLDPLAALRLAATLIHDQGSIVVSLPNASHAALLGTLLNHDFKYSATGLLDRTHIRFFSIKNMQNLFDSAGLAIVDFSFVYTHPNDTELAESWNVLSKKTQDFLESDEYAQVYQVIIRAIPKDQVSASSPALSLMQSNGRLRYIAFYLPQFHPIPENDKWWGKGFTEWTNVTKAQPLFPEHYQPHLPTESGFYDLRMREVQREQCKLARQYGIDAFCFHYYWFNGHRLLERPVLEFLADPLADIQFCLCWANENWTRKWDASEHEVLIEQSYSPDGDVKFIESVLPFFQDKRYVRVNGAPILIVYRPQSLPNPKETIEIWRKRCKEAGIEKIHVVAALIRGNRNYEQFGFDAGVEFPPHNLDSITGIYPENIKDQVDAFQPLENVVFHYQEVAHSYLSHDYSMSQVYRTVVPSWDNTARTHTRAVILFGGTPDNYECWLSEASKRTIDERSPNERLVFINAWNEWAEGCHLEPDRKYGRSFLEATLRVKLGNSRVRSMNKLPFKLKPEFSLTPPAVALNQKIQKILAIPITKILLRYPFFYKIMRMSYKIIRKVCYRIPRKIYRILTA